MRPYLRPRPARSHRPASSCTVMATGASWLGGGGAVPIYSMLSLFGTASFTERVVLPGCAWQRGGRGERKFLDGNWRCPTHLDTPSRTRSGLAPPRQRQLVEAHLEPLPSIITAAVPWQ